MIGARAPRALLVVSFVLAGLCGAQARAEAFERPASLEANVLFWRDVYVRYSHNEIVFHDREDLSLVYRVVAVPPHGQKKDGFTRREHVRRAEQELKGALARLDKMRPATADELTGVDREVFERLASVSREDKYRRASLIRAQNGLRERAREGWSRFGRYEPQVRQILREAGLPDDLVALAFVESLFNLHAKSHAGAAGMWQFMPATGREYMQVHHVLDERIDPILATEAATKYLNTARKQLGRWPLAITSYNYGRSGMARAVKAVGSDDFDVILARYQNGRFGFAARNYYACFLALLEVVRAPERYFPNVQREAPWRYDVVRLPFPVLADQLDEVGALSERELARYNPALTRAAKRGAEVLPRGFALRVPLGQGGRLLERLGALSAAERGRTEQHVRAWHRANGKETVARIARRYGVSASLVARRAGLSKHERPKKGVRVPIPSVEVRYTLLPEARGLVVPQAPTSPLVAEAPASSQVVATVTPSANGPRVRVRLRSAEPVPATAVLEAVDALTGAPTAPLGDVDGVAGDPGTDAPWALPDGDMRSADTLPSPSSS